jgi:chorismate-pyruvate lyase
LDLKIPSHLPEIPFLARRAVNVMLTTVPTFDHLYSLFPDSLDRSEAVEVSSDDVPEPYHKLLVHTHHMTITVEQFYRSSVDVRLLTSRRAGNEYARKILLATHDTRRVVQFGLVRIDLSVCPEPVRNEILEGKTPLGRVLIQHNMLRRIEPVAFLRVSLSPTMADWFGVQKGTTTYGRVGVIYTGDRPAVEVLEILAPIDDGKRPI